MDMNEIGKWLRDIDNYQNYFDSEKYEKVKEWAVKNDDGHVCERIIDVLYGVSYANDGDFKKIADRAYIITPNNVPVSGELGDEITSAPEEDF